MAAFDKISFEDARIGMRNFEGRETDYSPPGIKTFSVFLTDPELVRKLQVDGWNVKFTKPKDKDVDPLPFLPVEVGYKFPPRIVLMKGNKKRDLDEEDLKILDWIEIEKADIVVRPYNWSVGGKTGVKAYLKTMYITALEDEFEAKYASYGQEVDSSVDEDDPPFDL